MKNHPLIIVFYLDVDMMKIKDIIHPFVESVNQMLAQKDANALAFFMPTNGEERVECINPSIVNEADMDKINKIVEDLKSNFIVNIDVPDEEILLDKKECTCDENGTCNCTTKNN